MFKIIYYLELSENLSQKLKLQNGIVKGKALNRGVGQSPTNSRKIIKRQKLNSFVS
jgi:hypothetical protein